MNSFRFVFVSSTPNGVAVVVSLRAEGRKIVLPNPFHWPCRRRSSSDPATIYGSSKRPRVITRDTPPSPISSLPILEVFFSSIIRTLNRPVEFFSEIRTYTLKHVWKIYTRARARRSQRIRGATIASASHRVPSTTTGGCQKQLLLPTTTTTGEHARHAVTASGGGSGNDHPVE